MSEIINVTVLNSYIHNIFLAEEMLHNVQVCGEVSQYKVSGQHAYFTIKDENSQLSCNCFFVSKTYQPKVGESVLLTGSVDYYVKGGKLNFNVTTIKPIGNGYLAMLFEQLKKKLTEKGYFDQAHKKPIPRFCKRVCVITSASGAVIRDIVTTARARNNYVDIVVKDVKVQGESCSREVIAAIKEVDKMGFDAIVIARGGGSIEDLNGFNNEELVYTIFDAVTPIISAVGHETDFTLCDFVADMRCPTPTAAGQVIAFEQDAMMEYLSGVQSSLMNKLNIMLSSSSSKYLLLEQRMRTAFGDKISKNAVKVDNIRQNLDRLYKENIYQKNLQLAKILGLLDKNNPVHYLQKGLWAVNMQDKIVDNIDQVNVGDELQLKSHQGVIITKVTGVEK